MGGSLSLAVSGLASRVVQGHSGHAPVMHRFEWLVLSQLLLFREGIGEIRRIDGPPGGGEVFALFLKSCPLLFFTRQVLSCTSSYCSVELLLSSLLSIVMQL